MNYLHVLLLAVIQGLCELLPVSSSAHVIVTEKLLGYRPEDPKMTFLLIMLHTGTMFAVIVYFWTAWRRDYFSSRAAFVETVKQVLIASVATGIVYVGLNLLVKKVAFHGQPGAEIEQLFGNLKLIAAALAAVGVLILAAGRGRDQGNVVHSGMATGELTTLQAVWIGLVQGICLPFRGFSRSGATISTGMLVGVTRQAAERFSFALAVVLTPAAVAKEALRLFKPKEGVPLPHSAIPALLTPGLVGMVFSFLAGLLALRWLSQWLETGRWQWFGVYCIVAAGVVFYLATRGF